MKLKTAVVVAAHAKGETLVKIRRLVRVGGIQKINNAYKHAFLINKRAIPMGGVNVDRVVLIRIATKEPYV